MPLILGVDEAGRGAVCGPLVIAGALIDQDKLGELKKIGVKDSKLLTPQARTRIRTSLENLVEYAVVEIQPQEIDQKNLNTLEIEYFANIINQLHADKTIIDAMEKNTQKVRKHILNLTQKPTHLIAEHKADTKYVIVGAASIIAKTLRDQRIKELHKKFGNFGSGYPSDPRTKQFLQEWIQNNRFFPTFVRQKWSTIDALKQRKLTEFK